MGWDPPRRFHWESSQRQMVKAEKVLAEGVSLATSALTMQSLLAGPKPGILSAQVGGAGNSGGRRLPFAHRPGRPRLPSTRARGPSSSLLVAHFFPF